MKTFVFLVALSVSNMLWAQTFLGMGGSGESQVAEKAKKKAYLGGVDEDDLAVIEDYQAPYRVVNKRQIQQSVYESVLKSIEDESSQSSDDKASSQNGN